MLKLLSRAGLSSLPVGLVSIPYVVIGDFVANISRSFRTYARTSALLPEIAAQ